MTSTPAPLRTRLLVAGALAALAAVYLCLDPTQGHWPLRCPFRLLTGLQCPGCGSQRAMHCLLHGHLREAVGHNLYAILAWPYAAALLAAWLMPRGRLRQRLAAVLESQPVVWTYVVTFCIWFVARNILNI